MIAVDSSALAAIVFGESERDIYLNRMHAARRVLISAVSLVETRMVVYGRYRKPGLALLDDALRLTVIEVVPPGPADLEAAFAAFLAYGRGSGHPAKLNFGDVFSYALAKIRDVPLLFKGNDFSLTDIEPAVRP